MLRGQFVGEREGLVEISRHDGRSSTAERLGRDGADLLSPKRLDHRLRELRIGRDQDRER